MKFGDRLKQIVGNKAKGRISKRMFQENKARRIFRKKEHLLPPDTHTYVFRKIWRVSFS